MKLTGKQHNGIIYVNKGKGISSHGVVGRIRRILSMKRVGHTGTLDPEVTGLIPICVGPATRVAEYVLEMDKVYEGSICLGSKTTTQDSEGDVLEESDYMPSKAEVEVGAKKFIGPIEQIPPMYSAVRHKGKRLYQLAREGKVVERKPRQVYIRELIIKNYSYPNLGFECTCSKGTYMRTLANDLGEELGSFGHLGWLNRTQTGPIELSQAFTLDEIEAMANKGNYSFIAEPDKILIDFPEITLNPMEFDRLINGMRIPVDLEVSDRVYRVYCKGEFIGMARIIDQGGSKLAISKMLYQR